MPNDPSAPSPGERKEQDFEEMKSPADTEEAHPFDEQVTAEEEPQEERGAPGSRGHGSEHSPGGDR